MGCVPEKVKDKQNQEDQAEVRRGDELPHSRQLIKDQANRVDSAAVGYNQGYARPANIQTEKCKIRSTYNSDSQTHNYEHPYPNNAVTYQSPSHYPNKEPIFLPAKQKPSEFEGQSSQRSTGSVVRSGCKFMENWGQRCKHPECQQPDPFNTTQERVII